MADIFLSYAREDQSRVGPLVHALEGQGWSVFWDRRIPAGQTWRSHIGEALDAARCVIVAWSRDAIASDWVIEEADVARRRGVLVPILLDPVEPPMGLRAIQAADLTGWDDDPAAPRFRQLLDDIRAVLSTAPATAPPPLRMGEGAPPRTPPAAGDHPTPEAPRGRVPDWAPLARRWRYALALAVLLLVLTAGYFGYRAYTDTQAERLEQAVRLERLLVQTEAAIQRAQFDAAEEALRAAAETDPADPRLAALRDELAAAREASERAAELGRYLDEARRALEAEDVAAAERALAVAARIDADAPELRELRRELARLEAASRPDLRVWGSATQPSEPQQGQTVELAASIGNSGRSAAPATLVVWRERATGALIGRSRLDGLEPGERQEVRFTSTELTSRPGTVETVLEIDPEGTIEETDRGNNVQPVALRVGSAPSPPAGDGARPISFSNAEGSTILSGEEFADAGIRSIRAAPSGGYCADAEPAMLAAGSYQAPVSFLSTAERGDLKRCNGVPLRFDLRRPARRVTVDFYGAATDYWLTGYDAGGREVVRQAAQGNPYVYAKPYRVRIATDRADIAAFEFGHQAALTMIVAIELEY